MEVGCDWSCNSRPSLTFRFRQIRETPLRQVRLDFPCAISRQPQKEQTILFLLQHLAVPLDSSFALLAEVAQWPNENSSASQARRVMARCGRHVWRSEPILTYGSILAFVIYKSTEGTGPLVTNDLVNPMASFRLKSTFAGVRCRHAAVTAEAVGLNSGIFAAPANSFLSRELHASSVVPPDPCRCVQPDNGKLFRNTGIAPTRFFGAKPTVGTSPSTDRTLHAGSLPSEWRPGTSSRQYLSRSRDGFEVASSHTSRLSHASNLNSPSYHYEHRITVI
ncbi:hypothetical protein N657DRAFT_8555 [Parathielavia appendiculata]|uniref:Uncharacterized protein n=1 Tax=Parathielavia appendiculata TaxID=2587402 RepID=A0AAN6U862_9PEZI|nr:hypothetical protein N657DRAFT_8555 [Parathielavia appendiculata]